MILFKSWLLIFAFMAFKNIVFADEENSNVYQVEKEFDEEKDSDDKRYIGALAKNNRLPYSLSLPPESEIGKRYLGALANKGRVPFSAGSGADKRYIAAMAKNNRLPSKLNSRTSNQDSDKSEEIYETDKRYVAALAQKGRLLDQMQIRDQSQQETLTGLTNNQDDREENYEEQQIEKRYIGALAKNGRMPIFEDSSSNNDKRNLASLAKNGRMPIFEDSSSNDKRNLASLAANGRMPNFEDSSNNDKRNLASLAANGRLPIFEDSSNNDKRNLASLTANGRMPIFRDSSNNDKRNLASLAKNGRMPIFEKRNIASLAKNGRIPSNDLYELPADKRYFGALVKNGRLPIAEKRYVAALVKNGRMPSFHSGDDKRVAEFGPNAEEDRQEVYFSGENEESTKIDDYDDKLTNQEQLDKRNIASLARKGWLKHIRSYRSPGSGVMPPRSFSRYPIYGGMKRDLFLSRPTAPIKSFEDCKDENYEMSPTNRVNEVNEVNDHSEEKRNIAAMAKNGRLPNSLRPEYWSYKRNPISKYNRTHWPAAPAMFGPLTRAGKIMERAGHLRFVKMKSKRCKKSVGIDDGSDAPIRKIE